MNESNKLKLYELDKIYSNQNKEIEYYKKQLKLNNKLINFFCISFIIIIMFILLFLISVYYFLRRFFFHINH